MAGAPRGLRRGEARSQRHRRLGGNPGVLTAQGGELMAAGRGALRRRDPKTRCGPLWTTSTSTSSCSMGSAPSWATSWRRGWRAVGSPTSRQCRTEALGILAVRGRYVIAAAVSDGRAYGAVRSDLVRIVKELENRHARDLETWELATKADASVADELSASSTACLASDQTARSRPREPSR